MGRNNLRPFDKKTDVILEKDLGKSPYGNKIENISSDTTNTETNKDEILNNTVVPTEDNTETTINDSLNKSIDERVDITTEKIATGTLDTPAALNNADSSIDNEISKKIEDTNGEMKIGSLDPELKDPNVTATNSHVTSLALTVKNSLVHLDNTQDLEEDFQDPIDFGHLDIRVATVNLLGLHPEPSKSVKYAETITVKAGTEDDEPERYVVESGVPNLYPMEFLTKKRVVVLCNIKPVTFRGIETKIVVLCARKGKKIELLEAPFECEEGNPIIIRGYKHRPRKPYVAKIFERFGSDLKVNNKKQVEYKGIPLKVEGKESSFITTRTFKNCSVGTVMNYEGI